MGLPVPTRQTGLPDDAGLYHFTVGGPVEDARLATRAAYLPAPQPSPVCRWRHRQAAGRPPLESTGPLASKQPTFNRDNWGGVGQREKEAGAVSVRVHGKGIAGVKPKAEVLADILAAIRERRA